MASPEVSDLPLVTVPHIQHHHLRILLGVNINNLEFAVRQTLKYLCNDNVLPNILVLIRLKYDYKSSIWKKYIYQVGTY